MTYPNEFEGLNESFVNLGTEMIHMDKFEYLNG
jgi:hypothetical protein